MKFIQFFSCVCITLSVSSQAIVPHVGVPESQELFNQEALNHRKDNHDVSGIKTLTISNTYTPLNTLINTPVNVPVGIIDQGVISDQEEIQLINNNESDFLIRQSSTSNPAQKIIIVNDELSDQKSEINGLVEQPDLLELSDTQEEDGEIEEVAESKKDIESLLDELIEPEQVPLQAISPNTLRTFVTVVDLVRREYVKPVNDEKLFADAMQGMLKNLDPHAEFLDSQSYENLQAFTQGELANVGMQVKYDNSEAAWVVQSVDDDSPVKNAGIKRGFFLHQINEVQLDRSTLPIDIEQRLKGIAGSMVEVVMSDAGRRKQKYILQRTLTTQTPIKVQFSKGIAVVTIPVFHANTRQQILDALVALNRPIHGVVLDIRNNPGGVLGSAVDVAGLFLENQGVVQVEDRLGDMTLMTTEGEAYLKDIPVTVLQNRYSASAAEVLSSGLQFNKRATIIGETSYGKGTVQSVIPIENNQAVKLTVAHYLRPDGTAIEAEGVRPDVLLVRDEHEQFYDNLFDIVDQSNKVNGIDSSISGLNSHFTTRNNVKRELVDDDLQDIGRAKQRNEWQWQTKAVDILLEQLNFRNKHSIGVKSNSQRQAADINTAHYNDLNGFSGNGYYNSYDYDKETSPVPLDLDLDSQADKEVSSYSSSPFSNLNLSESDAASNTSGLLLVYPIDRKK